MPPVREGEAEGERLKAKGGEARVKREVELPGEISRDLARILRPQAAYRWILPQLAAITPKYVENVLRGALAGNHVQAWELFDLMEDSWAELAACAQELKYAVQRKKLVFEAYHEEDGEPSSRAMEKMRVVSAAYRNMRPEAAADENGLGGMIFDVLDAWLKGLSVQEVCWQVVRTKGLGELIGPRATFWVHPVCYSWDMAGRLGLRVELEAMRRETAKSRSNRDRGQGTPVWNAIAWQPRPSQIEEFPAEKFLVAIHKAKSGTALAGPMLRPLAWWWCAANFSADWLMNLAQIFGLPFRWASYQPGTPQATVDAICSMLETMGSATWAAFPAGTTLELKEAAKSGDSSPQGDLLDRADVQVRKLVLGQTMVASAGRLDRGGGGMAFGEVEEGVKGDRIEAAGDFACGVLNEQLTPMILRLNYGEEGIEEGPVARLLEDEEFGMAQAQVIATLKGAGLRIPVGHIYKVFQIPMPKESDDVLGEGQPRINTNGHESDEGKAAGEGLKAREEASGLEQAAVERLAAAVAADLGPLRERIGALAEIEDVEIFKVKARELLEEMDQLKADMLKLPKAAQVVMETQWAAILNGFAEGAASRGKAKG